MHSFIHSSTMFSVGMTAKREMFDLPEWVVVVRLGFGADDVGRGGWKRGPPRIDQGIRGCVGVCMYAYMFVSVFAHVRGRGAPNQSG